jgi:glycosyltransferase involved in cell wall biosynthesis
MARICIVTAGHLATCPRMLKAADALAGAGYRVRVVSTRYVDWATAADTEVRRVREGNWEWTVVDYHRRSGRRTSLWSGLRLHAAKALARGLGLGRCPLAVAARAYGRVHPELLRAALARPVDLFYGGTTGALAAVALAGRRARVPYALDLEDFHSAEQDDDPASRLAHGMAERIERAVLPGAAFLTAGSVAIASAYASKYGVCPIPINNTFPLPTATPDLTPSVGEGLRLYWFSQTIGPGRGLEDAVEAMGLADILGELHLRGLAIPDYLETLRELADDVAPELKIVCHEPAPPDSMVDLCRGYDVGLALEQEHVLNRALCLTNKAFTYMLGGLALVLTDTPGQRPLGLDVGEGAILYAPGDVPALAAGLKRWAEDKCILARARAAGWQAAQRRWHWEHPAERGALLGAVARALAR